MNKINDVIEQLNIGQDFQLLFGDFLDEFYASETDAKQEMLNAEPQNHTSIPKHVYSYIAASAHKLANDYSLAVPEWVYKDEYFLKDPYFSMNAKGNLRLILLYESPPEFKFRNIFEVSNTLVRV